jgi:Tfp pilus assembly protein PilN
MAVQFNLLPDVKLEYDRAQRAKRMVYTVSLLAMSIVIAVTAVSFFAVNVLQRKLLNDANNDINTYSQKLKSIPDLDKVLTIQNQLNSLPGLHQKKHITSRLFNYIPQVTPVNANIGKLTIDTTANTIDIDGTADTVETINKFVDTLKFTNYMIGGGSSDQKKAFSNVILTKVDRNKKNASYTIDANFDPALFDATQDVKLVVPQETTTRSVLYAPNANVLFNGETTSNSNDNNKQGSQ